MAIPSPIGFVGLGQMGRHMAANLVSPGSCLIVQSRNTKATAALAEAGATVATSRASFSEASQIYLSLPNGQVVREVLFDPGGLATHVKPGTIIVDTSTVGLRETKQIATELAERGIHFADAPVSGMEARAKDGTLTIMCGASAETFAAVFTNLEKLGKVILHVGDVGSGQLMKLINQLLFDINAAAIAEVLPMAVKLGLDPAQVTEVVNSGTGRSYASEFFAPRVLRRHFGDGYPLQAAYKDLISGADISAHLGIPMPVLAAATATYQQALLQGHGSKDKGAMIRVYEDLLRVVFEARAVAAEGDHA